uniref:Uncharacterized protein n=1 Tax=Hyaloperonospora arabidopsidis (strain Emoy2) TaxID=559515 RepID=M4BN73_HYAAE
MAILYGGYGHPRRLDDTFALRFASVRQTPMFRHGWSFSLVEISRDRHRRTQCALLEIACICPTDTTADAAVVSFLLSRSTMLQVSASIVYGAKRRIKVSPPHRAIRIRVLASARS